MSDPERFTKHPRINTAPAEPIDLTTNKDLLRLRQNRYKTRSRGDVTHISVANSHLRLEVYFSTHLQAMVEGIWT